MKTGRIYSLALLLSVTLLVGCAGLGVKLEQPEVKLISLRLLPAQGMEQRFAIGLSVSNPNPIALNLVGMSYSLRLQGHDLLSGVSNDIPTIEPYAETPLEITASINLLGSFKFIQSILQNPQPEISYELAAKLDTGTALLPAIRVVESGLIAIGKTH